MGDGFCLFSSTERFPFDGRRRHPAARLKEGRTVYHTYSTFRGQVINTLYFFMRTRICTATERKERNGKERP